MMTTIRRSGLRGLASALSESAAENMAHVLSRDLVEQLRTRVTDDFLELLLKAMEASFYLSRSYRRHIENFVATYVFATADGTVAATMYFHDGEVEVGEDAAEDFTARVTFADAAALRRFLFAEHQDILQSILANEVEVAGNINYIYKFGYMARDLERRLGLAA